MATVYLMELVVKMTKATKDQDHIDSIIFNIPSTPDRTSFLLDRQKESPLVPMAKAARELEGLGVSVIAIPCVTSHYFYDELSAASQVPVINMVEETALYLRQSGVSKAGILATTGTVSTGLFQRACEKQGILWEIPDEEGQKMVMELIYGDIKAGKPPRMELFDEVSHRMREKGCGCLILGCTELSLIKRDRLIGKGYLDALEVLARASVLRCDKEINGAYRSLL